MTQKKQQSNNESLILAYNLLTDIQGGFLELTEKQFRDLKNWLDDRVKR